jgi:release factor glutamine methyltransferase
MNLLDTLTEAATRIDKRDAELLLMHVLECDHAFIAAHPEASLTTEQHTELLNMVTRRALGEPVQYITGHQEFYALDFHVTPDVLIPRPETEHLVEAVLLWATQFHDERTLQIADIGTGSGAIVVALATHLAGAKFFATDISEAALTIARENAHAHECEQRIHFAHGDLLSGLALDEDFRFDAIVSNPPYVPTGDAATMQPEVVGHEPHTALFAGDDGLEIYRRLIPAARAALSPCGLLALEIGYGQRDALAALLHDWNSVRFIDDYQGIPRTVLALKP